MEIILVVLLCALFIFFFIAKNKYTKTDEKTGEVRTKLSCLLIEKIEKAENLVQINKIRVELKKADIPESTRSVLYLLLRKKRNFMLAEAEEFDLNRKGEFNDPWAEEDMDSETANSEDYPQENSANTNEGAEYIEEETKEP